MKSEILGVQIDNLTMPEVLRRIERFLTDGRQHYIVTPNPEFLVLAQKDKEFRRVLNQADLAVPDGVGLLFASRFLRRSLKERVSGTDLMEKVCQKAAFRKWPVFLAGGQQGIAEKAAGKLRNKYPGLKIEGSSFKGDFFDYKDLQEFSQRVVLPVLSAKRGESDKTLTHKDIVQKGDHLTLRPKVVFQPRVGSFRPAILFVALRAPKQEKWIAQNLAKIPSVKLAMGVGGAFNFISGRVKRAPRFLRLIGLEWLWRLICQPWRIKRIFKAVVVFPWLVVSSK
jgi:N-acetylglucosaminyldiphosphoundecaprenol N-acetyl-beta-D-mannosaminyltransferase